MKKILKLLFSVYIFFGFSFVVTADSNEIETFVEYDAISGNEIEYNVKVDENLSYISNVPTMPKTLSPRKIVGEDTRKRIKLNANWPYCAICHIKVYWNDGSTTSPITAFQLDESSFFTAAHCVYKPEKGGFPKRVVVTPGYSYGNTNAIPYPPVSAVNFHINSKYKEYISGNNNKYRANQYDYAIMKSTVSISKGCGMAIQCYSNQELKKFTLLNRGYPVDKGGEMWEGSGKFLNAIEGNMFEHTIDTLGGNSGSPIILWDPQIGADVICGLHIANYNAADKYNIGIKFDKTMLSWVRKLAPGYKYTER